MMSELKKVFERIEENEDIEENVKIELLNYLRANIRNNVYFWEIDDFYFLEKIMKDLQYDTYIISSFFTVSYAVKNALAEKNGTNKQRPNMRFVKTIYLMLEKIGFDYMNYDVNYKSTNLTLGRIVYRIINDKEILNNEISILDLTNKIYNEIYPNSKNKNARLCDILRILDMVERGVKELENKEKTIFLSEEIKDLFLCNQNMNVLNLTDIIKEFYPLFGNDIFKHIKNLADKTYPITTDEVMKYLRNIQEKEKVEKNIKNKILESTNRVEVDTKKKTVEVFEKLIKDIEINKYISIDMKENILSNIEEIFEKYTKKEIEFTDKQLETFFKNCEYYLNNLIIPNNEKKTNINSIISKCLENCKEFFIEYDGYKFKEIVNYIVKETDLSTEDLVSVSEKCSKIFKDTTINKLKIIKESLDEFKTFINKQSENSDNILENLFENVLINNPELLLGNEEKLKEVLKFLQGELDLKKYGYHVNFKIDKDFFTYDFLKNIAVNDYKVLFDTNIEKIINNLIFIENVCSNWDINFRKLKISENMIYTLLNEDFSSEGNYNYFRLKSLFTSKDLKMLIENNPLILTINNQELSLIVEKCILNENNEYPFYELLASELYYFNHEDFQNKSEQELLNSNFKYVNLNIEGNGNFDVLEILTSGVIIDFMKTEEIWKKYQKRKSFSNIEAAVEDLKLDKIDFDEFYNKINEIVTAYFNLYRNVPNISLRNKIIDLVSSKLEQYQYIINDNNELLNSENSLLSIYKIEKEDSIKIKKEVSKLLKEIDSDVIKNDINKFLQHIETKRLKESEKKEREISEKIIEIKNSVEELDKMVNELNYLLLLFNKKEKDHSIDNEFETKKYFDIESLNENKYAEKQEQELIDEILNGKNVVIFEESIYLSDIPNDKSFVDKINKFLGDGNFSITSQKFMKDNSMSGEFVEKYEDHRSKIWSRREDRTPVRVYFIPIYTKFFACYYVTGVNYKDDSHVDAGCKNDKVYNLRVKEAKIIEEKINSFNSIDEVIEFINQSKKDYEEVMKPIMMKKKKK